MPLQVQPTPVPSHGQGVQVHAPGAQPQSAPHGQFLIPQPGIRDQKRAERGTWLGLSDLDGNSERYVRVLRERKRELMGERKAVACRGRKLAGKVKRSPAGAARF